VISTDSAINLQSWSKTEKYDYAISSIYGVTSEEPNLIANLANAVAILKEVFQWWWVGFYLVDSEELVLGPFQGPVACTRIAHGKGVCGTSWASKKSLIVPDVHLFPGHIACSAVSNSEIVVPILRNSMVVAVLDVDSEFTDHFDETDRLQLEKISAICANWFSS